MIFLCKCMSSFPCQKIQKTYLGKKIKILISFSVVLWNNIMTNTKKKKKISFIRRTPNQDLLDFLQNVFQPLWHGDEAQQILRIHPKEHTA